MSEIVKYIIKHCNDEDDPMDISEYDNELTVEDLVFLRNSNLNIQWEYIESLNNPDYSLEFRLELVEWIDSNEYSICLDYDSPDELILRVKEKGFKIFISSELDGLTSVTEVLKYIDKHKLIGNRVRVHNEMSYYYDSDYFLAEYCRLINYPTKKHGKRPRRHGIIESINQGNIANMIDFMEEENIYNPFNICYLNARGAYNILRYSKEYEPKRFLVLVNLDEDLKYCIREEFDECWEDINITKITNRTALQYLKDTGRDIINTEDILENLIMDDQLRKQLQIAYRTTDLIDSFNHLDKLISLGTDNLLAMAILIRLLNNRMVDLGPHVSDNPFLEHLYQFQYRPKVKNARSAAHEI